MKVIAGKLSFRFKVWVKGTWTSPSSPLIPRYRSLDDDGRKTAFDPKQTSALLFNTGKTGVVGDAVGPAPVVADLAAEAANDDPVQDVVVHAEDEDLNDLDNDNGDERQEESANDPLEESLTGIPGPIEGGIASNSRDYT